MGLLGAQPGVNTEVAMKPPIATSETQAAPDGPPRAASKPARISDKNLRLAVLEGLFAEGIARRPTRAHGREFRYNPDIFAALDAVQPTAGELARVTSVRWGLEMEAIAQIFPQWDGEGDEFDVLSLTGIGALAGLRVLQLELFCGRDLRPLAGLAALETLRLVGGEGITDLAPLAGLTALRSVTLEKVAPSDANRSVIEALRAQGAHVQIGAKHYRPHPPTPTPVAVPALDSTATAPSEATLDALRAAEREMGRMWERGKFGAATEAAEKALALRERLVAGGALHSGATGPRPAEPTPYGGIPFEREENLLAGVTRLAAAYAASRQERERGGCVLRAGRMLADAGRHERETVDFLTREAFHLSASRSDDDAALELARWALEAATRGAHRVDEAHEILANALARKEVPKAKGKAKGAYPVSLAGLRVCELDAAAASDGPRTKEIAAWRQALALRRELVTRGELAAGAGLGSGREGLVADPRGRFDHEPNELAGLTRLADALARADKKAEAFTLQREGAEMLLAAGRSEPHVLGYLLAAARESAARGEREMALRFATAARAPAAASSDDAFVARCDELLSTVGANLR